MASEEQKAGGGKWTALRELVAKWRGRYADSGTKRAGDNIRRAAIESCATDLEDELAKLSGEERALATSRGDFSTWASQASEVGEPQDFNAKFGGDIFVVTGEHQRTAFFSKAAAERYLAKQDPERFRIIVYAKPGAQEVGDGLRELADEVNQCLQIIVTNAGLVRGSRAREIEKAVERAKKATWAALAAPASKCGERLNDFTVCTEPINHSGDHVERRKGSTTTWYRTIPAPKPARANTLEYLGWLVSELELTANGIWGVRELRGDIQAVKERVQKLGVDLQSAAPKPAPPAEPGNWEKMNENRNRRHVAALRRAAERGRE